MTMTDALFEDLGSGHYRATALSIGPWSRDALHGGAPSALLAGRLIEAIDAAAMGDFVPARFTAELLRPVPLTPLRLSAHVRRPGRKVAVADASLVTEDGTTVMQATLSCIRDAPVDHGSSPTDVVPSGPGGGSGIDTEGSGPVAFHSHAVQHRFVDGRVETPGPAVDWIRLVVPVLGGVDVHPLERVAAATDFGNGISALFTFDEMLFINPVLSVFLTQLPAGEWIGLDAQTRVGPVGVGWAESLVFDTEGVVGRSVQTLLVEPR